MRIQQVEVFPFYIAYRGEFSISRGKVGGGSARRSVVLVKLTDEDGCVGWGEGSPSHLWSSETMESVVAALRGYLIPAVFGCPVDDLDGLHRRMEEAIGPAFSIAHPIAKCALDTALHDLLGRRRGLSIAQLWGYRRGEEAVLSWTVSTKDLGQAEALLEEGLARGYSHFNVKLGVTPEYDAELCRLVKRKAPEGFLWGDANGGYTYAQAIRTIPALEEAGLDLLEQPFPSNRMSLWRELKKTLRVPLAVDEPILTPEDLMEWIRQDLVSAYATKVTRNAGLFPSRQCVELAEHAGLMTVCSGLTETGVGLAANLHLAAAFGIRTPCAWNGPQFLADDILGEPLEVTGGKLAVPAGPGLGIRVDEEKVRRYCAQA